jgi:hypothetical protein
MGSGSSPSPMEFSSHHCSHKLSRSWLLGAHLHSHPLWSGPTCLFTVLGWISPPPSLALMASHPVCYVSLLFLLLIIQFFFSFFPGWVSVCPGGYADLAQGCLWEYRVLLSSLCGPCLPKPSGRWRLVALGPSWFLHLM